VLGRFACIKTYGRKITAGTQEIDVILERSEGTAPPHFKVQENALDRVDGYRASFLLCLSASREFTVFKQDAGNSITLFFFF
jgi:hypothetical protein